MGIKRRCLWMVLLWMLCILWGGCTKAAGALQTEEAVTHVAGGKLPSGAQDHEETEVHIHDFTKSVWEAPTCEKSGYYNNICNSCGLVECVTQEPLAHEVEDIVVQEGNCMEDTIIRHVCKNCGLQVEVDTRITPYDAHVWVTDMVDGVVLTYCEWCGVSG